MIKAALSITVQGYAMPANINSRTVTNMNETKLIAHTSEKQAGIVYPLLCSRCGLSSDKLSTKHGKIINKNFREGCVGFFSLNLNN